MKCYQIKIGRILAKTKWELPRCVFFTTNHSGHTDLDNSEKYNYIYRECTIGDLKIVDGVEQMII